MVVRRSLKTGNTNLKRTGRRLRYLIPFLLLALFFFLLPRVILVGKTRGDVMTDEKLKAVSENQPVDGIVVLGAGVYEDGTLSPMLRNRLEKTVSLYQTGISKKILCTGDHRPGEYDEVDHMAEYLIQNGIPEENIIRDYEGFSTSESMENAAKSYHLRRIILVTQEYHLYRGIYLGQHYGMEVYGSIAENAGVFTGRFYRTLREDVASVKDFLYCLFMD